MDKLAQFIQQQKSMVQYSEHKFYILGDTMQVVVENSNVQAVFDRYSEDVQAKLMQLRHLILEVASQNPKIGALEETLKWGQISYLPKKRKVGTTVRIDKVKDSKQVAMFVPCSTTLLDTYRTMYADDLTFEGDRAILLDIDTDLPIDKLRACIELALTYHLKS